MKKTALSLKWLTLLLACVFCFASCSNEDESEIRTEEDILGLWQDKEGHILDLADPDHIYEYTLREFDGEKYWYKKRVMYLYEPVSLLLMKEDTEGNIQVYQLISYSDTELVWCWVGAPEVDNLEGDNKYELFKVFFDKGYEVDPSRYETFHKITRAQLDKQLEGAELLEP